MPAAAHLEAVHRLRVAVHQAGERHVILRTQTAEAQAGEGLVLGAIDPLQGHRQGSGRARAGHRDDGERARHRTVPDSGRQQGGGQAHRAGLGGDALDRHVDGPAAQRDLAAPADGERGRPLELAALGADAERRARGEQVEQVPQADHQHQVGHARLEQVAPRRHRTAHREQPVDGEEGERGRREMVVVEADALVGDVEGGFSR